MAKNPAGATCPIAHRHKSDRFRVDAVLLHEDARRATCRRCHPGSTGTCHLRATESGRRPAVMSRDARSHRSPARRARAPGITPQSAGKAGKRDGWMFRIRLGKASSSGGPTRRMKPARQGRATPRDTRARRRARGRRRRGIGKFGGLIQTPQSARQRARWSPRSVGQPGNHHRNRRRKLTRRNRVDDRLSATPPEMLGGVGNRYRPHRGRESFWISTGVGNGFRRSSLCSKPSRAGHPLGYRHSVMPPTTTEPELLESASRDRPHSRGGFGVDEDYRTFEDLLIATTQKFGMRCSTTLHAKPFSSNSMARNTRTSALAFS